MAGTVLSLLFAVVAAAAEEVLITVGPSFVPGPEPKPGWADKEQFEGGGSWSGGHGGRSAAPERPSSSSLGWRLRATETAETFWCFTRVVFALGAPGADSSKELDLATEPCTIISSTPAEHEFSAGYSLANAFRDDSREGCVFGNSQGKYFVGFVCDTAQQLASIKLLQTGMLRANQAVVQLLHKGEWRDVATTPALEHDRDQVIFQRASCKEVCQEPIYSLKPEVELPETCQSITCTREECCAKNAERPAASEPEISDINADALADMEVNAPALADMETLVDNLASGRASEVNAPALADMETLVDNLASGMASEAERLWSQPERAGGSSPSPTEDAAGATFAVPAKAAAIGLVVVTVSLAALVLARATAMLPRHVCVSGSTAEGAAPDGVLHSLE